MRQKSLAEEGNDELPLRRRASSHGSGSHRAKQTKKRVRAQWGKPHRKSHSAILVLRHTSSPGSSERNGRNQRCRKTGVNGDRQRRREKQKVKKYGHQDTGPKQVWTRPICYIKEAQREKKAPKQQHRQYSTKTGQIVAETKAATTRKKTQEGRKAAQFFQRS